MQKKKKTGSPHVEYFEYEEEGHMLEMEQTRRDMFPRMARFLEQHLGTVS